MRRVGVQICGQVQGVGFRPFVYQLAAELGLTGWVRNDGQGVALEVQGDDENVSRFLERLRQDLPPLAAIDTLALQPRASAAGEHAFRIATSDTAGPTTSSVTPDAAVCRDCLQELFDPADRRHRHPFINCTHCGPRYTITRALPYDRVNTSMGDFAMCEPCQREYDDPTDRRFHAQPNACADCGPRLSLVDGAGNEIGTADCIARALTLLRAGQIVAIKGLGGFHLACDARNAHAVARLRTRKNRDEKPFAVMLASPVALESLVQLDAATRELLQRREAPIVLLRKRPACDAELVGVAPGLAWLGAMLPYTPVHHLLFHEAAGRPAGRGWADTPPPLALVMTSANPGGEPLVTDNAEALDRLGGIADAILLHDRDIYLRCDDSVMRLRGDATAPAFIRRGRGYTPSAIRLPAAGPSTLACGGWYKSTICLTRGAEAFVSQHIGDLDNAPTCVALEQTVAHLMDVLCIEPERVAHDLHPDFFSSRFAASFASERGLPVVGVQHHHAHAAAVAAEHSVTEPLLALALDGVGLGTDGQAWGGELLRVDGADFRRLGRLHPLALPGGDRAAREPWRMAASVLAELGRADEIARRFPQPAAEIVSRMLARDFNTPLTSSAGRLFDAAAGLLRVRDYAAYEAQAAMLLEGLAETRRQVDPLEDGFTIDEDEILSLLPTLEELLEETDPARGAARFHATLAAGLATWVSRATERTGLVTVALGGGCLLNSLVATDLRRMLGEAGLRVLEASQVPPNDGGLSLGQAWIAMQTAVPATEEGQCV